MELSEIRTSSPAVNEAAYYGPLANLQNEISKTLKPDAKYIMRFQTRGQGSRMAGCLLRSNFRKPVIAESITIQLSARGAIIEIMLLTTVGNTVR